MDTTSPGVVVPIGLILMGKDTRTCIYVEQRTAEGKSKRIGWSAGINSSVLMSAVMSWSRFSLTVPERS